MPASNPWLEARNATLRNDAALNSGRRPGSARRPASARPRRPAPGKEDVVLVVPVGAARARAGTNDGAVEMPLCAGQDPDKTKRGTSVEGAWS